MVFSLQMLGEIPLHLHKEALERRDDDAPTVQFQKASALHVVECTAHVEPTVVDLNGQTLHENMHLFPACRIVTMVSKEAAYAVGQPGRDASPRAVSPLLGNGGKEVEQVQAKSEEVVEETQHLVF